MEQNITRKDMWNTAAKAGLALGLAWYRYLYLERYEKSEVLCNEKEKDREIQKQLERLMAYGGREV